MYERDYLMRQISRLIRFLVDTILYSDKKSSAQKEEAFAQVYSITGISKENIFEYDSDQLINLLGTTDSGLDKLEMLAYTLLGESGEELNEAKRMHLRSLSKDVLEYVDRHSDLYSLERKSILNGFS